ncbi:carbon dioxide concentrating mechanism protein CcmM [Clostridium cavendishii DSM 21758]|uniref:Carbon dioxide concentrating mechanism protein CcmM n=1 Tax=Clostridium cavendishii DSM 21758 TaxID=1121302 RepID=A0A1M6KWT0_9CLOT|nr:carbonate dehydratase [Clostridium cavendishii]SHJ63370.1 carbon dioxide concentrating mechanism protein CcmM [Clostridium cavendishii DSM 21758]
MSKYNTLDHSNIYSYFISSNPITSFNPVSIYPTIHKTAFISPFSSIIGDVRICSEVFIGCNSTLRADEGTPFYIDHKTNIQDGVTLHGLKNMKFTVNEETYSIYIGKEVSIAHGALIHGPCIIGNNTFVGFNAIVFNSIVEDSCYIDLGAIITNGVRIPSNRYVPVGAIINTQEKANALGMISQNNEDFAKGVVKSNIELSQAYSLKFGDTRCNCGLSYNLNDLNNLENK